MTRERVYDAEAQILAPFSGEASVLEVNLALDQLNGSKADGVAAVSVTALLSS